MKGLPVVVVVLLLPAGVVVVTQKLAGTSKRVNVPEALRVAFLMGRILVVVVVRREEDKKVMVPTRMAMLPPPPPSMALPVLTAPRRVRTAKTRTPPLSRPCLSFL